MNQDLERYLNDHLAGSFGAVSLIDDVATRQEEEPEREFFLRLKESVETDQALLKRLIDHGGMEQSKPLQVTGTLAAKAGRLKLLWEGLGPGELGMFEALEMITLGIQGKRLLWVMLGEIAPQVPSWQNVDFAALELAAVRQHDAVEVRRIKAGREALSASPAAPEERSPCVC